MKSPSPLPTSNGHSSQASAKARQTPDINGPAASADAPSPDTFPNHKGDRDHRGRFAPGNKGGPGNPFARRTAALRQAMLDAVTPEDVQAIVRQMVQKARAGDVAAARLVLAYAVGKPDRAVDPDAVDVHEFQLWQQSAVANQDLSGVLGQMQAGLANELFRLAVPGVQEATADKLGQALRDPLPEEFPGAAANPEEATERNETASRAPQQGADAPRSPGVTRGEKKRNTPDPESGDADGEAMLEEMYREYERDFRLGLLQEMARLVMDQQRPEATVGQPAPSPNGFLTDPTQRFS